MRVGGRVAHWSLADVSAHQVHCGRRESRRPLAGQNAAESAPARTSATRCGPFTARQRSWAAWMSLNAMAGPAAREPGPLQD